MLLLYLNIPNLPTKNLPIYNRQYCRFFFSENIDNSLLINTVFSAFLFEIMLFIPEKETFYK